MLLLAALVAAAVAYRSTVAAQARAVVVLSATLDVPGLEWTLATLLDEPRERDVRVAGVPTVVVRPARGEGPWPSVVFVNGATTRGRHHPTVRRLARGLARAGYLVLVPDPPGLAAGELTSRTLAGTVRVVRTAADRRDARAGRVSVIGVSSGASLALLAAQQRPLADRVRLVAGLAPYTDLRKAIELATTGRYRLGGRHVRYRTEPFLALVLARSLVAWLPHGQRAGLRRHLLAVDDDDPDPLAGLRRWRRPLGREARAVVALLTNRDPARFEARYRALPPAIRADVARLSPIRGAARIRARVELASEPRDKYFPPAESRALAAAAPDARVTVTSALSHAELSIRDLREFARLDAFIVRVLRSAADHARTLDSTRLGRSAQTGAPAQPALPERRRRERRLRGAPS